MHKDGLKKEDSKKGITQEKMAEYLGWCLETYRNYEAGETEMTADTAKKLAEYFDVSVNYILTGDSEPEHNIFSEKNSYVEELKNALKLTNGTIDIISEAIKDNSFQDVPDAETVLLTECVNESKELIDELITTFFENINNMQKTITEKKKHLTA